MWLGTGAAWLGLTGEVAEEGLARLLEGRDPTSGLVLRSSRSLSAVAGFDLMFRATKSVSSLLGVAEPDVTPRITVLGATRHPAMAFGMLNREPSSRPLQSPSTSRLGTHPDSSATQPRRAQFSSGGGGSVFTRRRHVAAGDAPEVSSRQDP